MSGTIAFPPNPTVGQTYTFNNTTWVWNGTVWTNANIGTNFLPLSGGTMTPPGTIAGATLQQPTINQPAIMGVTDGSNAAAGEVGEYIVAAGGTGGVANLTNLDSAVMGLNSGDWDVWGIANFTTTGSGTAGVVAGLSTSSLNLGSYFTQIYLGTFLGNTNLPVPRIRVSSAAPITVYLVVQANFTSGSVDAQSTIFARRVR